MEWKNVRIFISSTFNDMHAERDYLVKHVFPELSEWCEERKLRLIDIDLRWGVTAEDSRNNHTVYACLHNIDESRPFFLCFLGQRRGWVPDESDLSSDTLKSYPGLTSLVGKRSITEMEVEHALLSPMMRIADEIAVQPDAVSHALFFLRDGSFISQINEAQRPIFTNSSDPDPAGSDRKLAEFREFIKGRWADTYDYKGEWDPDEVSPELSMIPDGADEGRLEHFTCNGRPLSDVIIEALKREIETEFPDHVPSAHQTDFERDLELQTFFAEQNCLGYIERTGDFDALRDYVDGGSRGIMVIAAPAGQGKTSLLSKFSSDLRTKGGVRVISRSCGATDMCSSVYGVFSSILTEAGCSVPPYEDLLIRNIEQVLADLADNPTAADKTSLDGNSDMADNSSLTDSNEKTVVIIDAVNQLPRGAEIFRWMPRMLPEGLKLIFSIKQDEDSREVIEHLGSEANTIVGHIRPFGRKEDKEAVINAYLSNYLKKLDDDQIDMICSLDASENPLYLKVLLSELRVFGTFRLLSEEIQRFGDTAVSAFDAVLARLESDLDHCSLASDEYVPLLFGLLSASRAGLSEEEILTCVLIKYPDADEEGLAEALHIYMRQMRSFMTRRDGRWDFFYESFRIAADNRYRNEAAVSNRLLHDYFDGIIRESAGTDARSCRAEGESAAANDFTASARLKRAYSEAAWHLYQSDRDGLVPGDETCSLLLSADWIQGKLSVCGAESLLEDYICIPEGSCPEELLYLRRALRASAHVLRDRPDALAEQLIGRLKDIEAGRIQALLSDLAGRVEHSWLEPLGKTLTGPLDARVVTLSGHSAEITDAVFCRGYICTGDADGLVRIWDTETWQCLRILPAHNKMNVRFVHKSEDLITWASSGDMTVFKKWDIFSGTLIATCNIDKKAGRTRIFKDMLIALDYRDLISAHRLSDLSVITGIDEIGLPEGFTADYTLAENQLLKESGAHIPAGDHEIYAQGKEAVVLRRDVEIERQSDLPVSIVETLPDGGCAACGTYGYVDEALDKTFGDLFKINIYDRSGEKVRSIPVPRLSRIAVCGDRLVYSHSKEGQSIYYGRNEVIHFLDIQADYREVRSIETMIGYYTDEDGKKKRMLLGADEILSMVMIDGDLFCLDKQARLVVVRKDQEDFDWDYWEEVGFTDRSNQRLFRYGDELGYIGGVSRENENKGKYKTVFRLYDPKTLEMTREIYIKETAVGIAFGDDLAALVCNGANDSILIHDGDAYISVRDRSLTEEYYRIDVDCSVISALEYLIGNPLEKAGYSRDSGRDKLDPTTHAENHLIFSDGYLFISSGNRIMQLDAKTGAIVAETESEDLYFMGIALSGDTLFAGTSTGKVLRYGIRHGEKVSTVRSAGSTEADAYEFFTLPDEDRSYYDEIVLNELDSEKRLEALDHVDDQEVLRQVFTSDEAPAVRAKAAGKITDQVLLADRALEDQSEVVCKAAVSGITDPDVLDRYITDMIASPRALLTDAFIDAVSRCENDRLLYDVCCIEHQRFWKKYLAAERIKSYEYQYALLCDHNTNMREDVMKALDPDYVGDLPAAFIDRTLVYEQMNYIANLALAGSDNVRLIMLELLKHRGETMADDRLKELRSGFPKKYDKMDFAQQGEYLIGCMQEVARVSEGLLAEDERVRRMLPDDVPIDSSVLYAAIALYSPDPVKRLLSASHLPEEAMAFVGPRTLYNDVRIFLSRQLESDDSIRAACEGTFPIYNGIAGTSMLTNPELQENFLNLLRVNARYDDQCVFVDRYMSNHGLTKRPPADWVITNDRLLEEFLASPNLGRGELMAVIMLQHGSGCYDDSILILDNAITVGKKDPVFIRDLILDPMTEAGYAALFKRALFSAKLDDTDGIEIFRREVMYHQTDLGV